MPIQHPGRTLIIVWLAWAFILLGFQALTSARFQPQRPDLALDWLRTETLADSHKDKTYLFPSGFFLAQVYTEGLFVGAAFGCLAMLRRKQWLAAGALAVLAVWTRAIGIALFISLAIAWLGEFDRQHIGRAQARVYYAVEFAAIILGVAACGWTLRDYPGIALFGVAVIVLSLSSGVAQGMHRYVLVVPSIFLALGRLGKSAAFDRGWSLLSTLLMGMYATLFAFDLWAG